MSEQEYIEQRKEKAAKLAEMGHPPYPAGIVPTHTAWELHHLYNAMTGEELEDLKERFAVAGRIVAIRSFGKAAFIHLQDRSGKIQIFVQKQSLPEKLFEIYKLMDVGDFAWFSGPLFKTKTNELSVKAEDLKVAAKAIRALPEKWHGLTDIETRYRNRHIDLIVNPDVKKTFQIRSHVIQSIRDFLNSRGFLEVETPMMHHIPGGAAAKPFVTHHHKLGCDLFLRIAPELFLKRLVIGGFERVYEINRNFRNEGISIQHNPEFTMLEFYQSYATFEDLMRFTEELIPHVALKVLGKTAVTYQGVEINLAPPYARYTLKEALLKIGGLSPDILQSRDKALKYALSIGDQIKSKDEGIGAILTEIFELTVEKKLIQPTFITHYPTEVSPLARKNDNDPSVTDRFELFIYGREIANAFTELNDPSDQAERFRAQLEALDRGNEEAMHFDQDYIEALEHGMPPTAGEGIGIDRLVMILTDSASIRDVILFPQLKPKAT
jgi:lysyl-tRNA synthetase class 2